MKTKAAIGGLFLLALAAGAFAQDYIYDFRGAFVDVPLKSPCAVKYARTLSVSGPHLYDNSAWITFVCEDGEVIARRYHNPIDNANQRPIAVFSVPNPAIANPDPNPGLPVACTVPGMVTSIYGGCVPPDHPNAPR